LKEDGGIFEPKDLEAMDRELGAAHNPFQRQHKA